MDTKNQNPSLEEVINTDNPLKEMIVDYVGKKVKPENDEVTLEMVVAELANEFEELVFSLAEENWIRGYHQALDDAEAGRLAIEEINKQQDVQ